jgi:PAS domain S-box-containing protein
MGQRKQSPAGITDSPESKLKIKNKEFGAIAKLEQSEKRFREFFENAPEGIMILDIASLKFIKCNRNATFFLKYSADELKKMGPADLSPEFQPDGTGSMEKANNLIAGAMKGKRTVFEWLVKKGDGGTAMFEVRLMALSNAKPRLYASFIDITERKSAENKLQSQNRMLTQIASLQSHQVRAPIASILGLINLFNFSDLSNPVNAEILLKVQAASLKFDRIIKEIVITTHQIEKDM